MPPATHPVFATAVNATVCQAQQRNPGATRFGMFLRWRGEVPPGRLAGFEARYDSIHFGDLEQREHTLLEFRDMVRKGRPAPGLNLDLSEVPYMDSASLGALLGRYASSRSHGQK
jgi:hypothetical protein